jgi:hypothetical protein
VKTMTGVEPSFGTNSFNQAKYKNETETVANSILALLFGKPGFFPSMPELGIDIQKTIYMFWDEIDTDVLKAQIVAQCSEFKSYVNDGSLDIVKSIYNNQPLLLVVIPVQVLTVRENLIIGITQDSNGNTSYNYVFEETVE